jgi:hypothetical protein
MRLLLVITIIVLCAEQAIGQKCSVDSGFRGATYSIDRYKNRDLIKTIQRLSEIPVPVRSSLEAHLKSKLGEAFSRKVKFGWGYWIDLERLKRESPRDYEWNEPMGSYDLVFWFSDTKKGLKSFYFNLVLNDDGSIRKGMNLPDIATHPEKVQIISCKEAYTVAMNQGFPRDTLSARFDYSEEEQSFVWIVTDIRGTKPDEPLIIAGKGTYKHIEINANTGSVVRIYKETIIL